MHRLDDPPLGLDRVLAGEEARVALDRRCRSRRAYGGTSSTGWRWAISSTGLSPSSFPSFRTTAPTAMISSGLKRMRM